jgi:hypothetical protein
LNISGVILTRFGSNPKIGTKESRADLGNEFFHCIIGIGKPLAAKVAVKPALMSDCVATFMTQGRVVGFTIPEALQLWHLHKVAVGTVKRPAAAVLNGDFRIGKKLLDTIQPIDCRVERRHGRIKMAGQSVNLLGIENRVTLQKRDFDFDGCAFVLMLWAAAVEKGYGCPLWLTYKQAGRDTGPAWCPACHGCNHVRFPRSRSATILLVTRL